VKEQHEILKFALGEKTVGIYKFRRDISDISERFLLNLSK
jgi:hypothetical protein